MSSLRRAERDKVNELKEAILAESKKESHDREEILHMVRAALCEKHMRLSDSEMIEFAIYEEFEDSACVVFINSVAGWTREQSKEMAAEILR